MKPKKKSNVYKRHRQEKGLSYPTTLDKTRAFRSAKEQLFVPKGALLFGENPRTGSPIYTLPKQLDTHLHVIGGSGRGKSFFLRRLIQQFFLHHDRTGEGIAIVDPHGTLAEYALDLCVERGAAFAEKVVYFDLKDESQVPVFNPLHVADDRIDDGRAFLVAQSFVEALSKVSGAEKTTDKWLTSQVILNIAGVLLYNRLTPVEAPFFIEGTQENLRVRRSLLENVPKKQLRDFWAKIETLRVGEHDMYTAPAGRRFEYLLNTPPFRRILGQTTAGLDLRALMDQGGIAIFDLSRRHDAPLTLQSQGLFGALLVQEFRNVTEQRKPDVSRPFTLIVDEFGDFVTPDAMRIFTGARKFGLRCVLAHQDLQQLVGKDDDFRLHAGVLGIENKVVFRPETTADATKLAEEMYAGFVDTNKRKLELWSLNFEPVPTKVTLHARSTSTDSGESSGGSRSTGASRTVSDGDRSSNTEGESSSDTWGRSSREGATESEHEAFVTMYKKFRQRSSVQFDAVADQIYRHMQALLHQPRGYCTVMLGHGEPQPCVVPDMTSKRPPDAAREAFLAKVYGKPIYLSAAEADQRIAERERRLLSGTRETDKAKAVRVKKPRTRKA